jgi:hypothetical protein
MHKKMFCFEIVPHLFLTLDNENLEKTIVESKSYMIYGISEIIYISYYVIVTPIIVTFYLL